MNKISNEMPLFHNSILIQKNKPQEFHLICKYVESFELLTHFFDFFEALDLFAIDDLNKIFITNTILLTNKRTNECDYDYHSSILNRIKLLDIWISVKVAWKYDQVLGQMIHKWLRFTTLPFGQRLSLWWIKPKARPHFFHW